MPAPNAITPAQLLRLIGTPEAPLIVDLCLEPDFAADPYLIPTARRASHTDLAGIAVLAQNRHTVAVCQKGRKISQGLAAWLRAEGLSAEYLEGGMVAWRALDQAPAVPAAKLPRTQLWVTRHRPKIDRIACPWLIRRFVDPTARFLFVAPSEVAAVAERFGAEPFDTREAFWTHRGEGCTFDIFLIELGLATPALTRLATVIRAADTNRHELAPEAVGLLALSVGLSRQYRDDQAKLRAGLALYDALYRWARDGVDEAHDWQAERA